MTAPSPSPVPHDVAPAVAPPSSSPVPHGVEPAVAPPLPIHAETTPDDAVVRWVVPATAVPGRGHVTRAAEPLARLQREGVVTEIECDDGALLVRLAPTASWREWAEPVRRALVESLAQPGEWETEGRADLAAVLAEVLAGPTGEFIASHGGTVRVIRVDGDDAVVQLGGNCGDCPLQGFTLQRRIGEAVRERYPQLRTLEVERGKRAFRPRFRVPVGV
nr:NifU family protein [Actinomycetales bacterium]